MVERAWVVLADCKHACDLLEDESRPETFRVLWVAGIALARAVGHVLQKVDGETDKATMEAVQRAYKRWKSEEQSNAIFREFIEEERNLILKEYEIRYHDGPTTLLAEAELFTLDEDLYRPVLEGTYVGEDCRDVLRAAIEWWEVQLKAIEADLKLADKS